MHLAYFSEDYSALQEDMFERILQNEENKLRPLCKLVPCESFCEPIEESKCVSPRINKPNRARRDRDTERLAAKCKKNRGVDPANKNRKNGHWDLEENKRYHWFLEIHSSHFIQKHLRRMDKIFKSMALFVATREAEQCRSHHQKMEKKFYTFAEIIKNLRTQHYGSTDTDALIDEIASNAIPFNEALILPLNELRSV